MAKPVIITCAVTGGIHTPTMSPHLPITPDEIARDAVACMADGSIGDFTNGLPVIKVNSAQQQYSSQQPKTRPV